jgi:catechol 2,3-dioxygenase-like lactoylglutathione lyase family enzyme
MVDHPSMAVADVERARRLYDSVLAALGGRRLIDIEDGPDFIAAGYGVHEGEPAFSIGAGKPARAAPAPPDGQHIAFAAPDRAAVGAFHRVALAAGGCDNGAPGIRADDHANYYAAFVIDPDGNHIEAVCHKPA